MLVVGYPKSGNTWICYLISYSLNAEYDDLDEIGVHPKDPYQRKYVKGGFDHRSYQSELGQVLKTHRLRPETNGEKVVYIVRDPRDVMISFYFYLNNFQNKSQNISMYEFIKKHMPDWKRHVTEWLDKADTIIKYEDVSANTPAALDKAFKSIGISIEMPILEQAEEIFNFNKLSNRKKGEEDKSSFFRKGIVGDWKNHFDNSEKELLKELVGDLLIKLGYEKDLKW